MKLNVPNVTLEVINVTRGSDTYWEEANHDSEGDSDGTGIMVDRP
jgi:hypothetical protein